MTRLTRDQYGLKLAEAAALRADCTRRQVGAVIIAEDGSVISTGYNGLPAGRPGCLSDGACPRGQLTYEEHPADVGYEATGCRAVHAEVNAIIRAGRERCIGATIYVTDTPCFHCSVVIDGAGLARTVTPSDLALEEASDRATEYLRERLAAIFPPEDHDHVHFDVVGNPAAEVDPEPLGPGERRPLARSWAEVTAHRESLLSEADRLWLIR